MENPETCYNHVYYVESQYPRNPVAIRPHLTKEFIEWEDTGRGTAVKIEEIKVTPSPSSGFPEKIEITSPEGEKLTLVKLSLNLYNEKVKENVAGQPEFNSDQELEQYYLITNFGSY